jgi:hypothetical protein
MIDPGPTHNFHASMIPPELVGKNQVFMDFEFGREYEFLRIHKATSSVETVQGILYDVLTLKLQGFNVRMLSAKGKEQPFQVIISKDNRVVCQYDYDEYKTRLPFQPELFQPPSGIAISEEKKETDNAETMKALEDFGQRTSEFYLSPTREMFLQNQKEAEKLEGVFAAKGEYVTVSIGVGFARIAEKYGWPIEGNGIAAKRAKEILEGKSELARYVKDDALVDPTKLDIWWASFFAAGNTEYLQKLLAYAGEPLPKDNIPQTLLTGAATWSFKANCGQHAAVREFARTYLKNEPSSGKKEFLKECIASGSQQESVIPH